METNQTVKNEIKRQIDLVMSDPRFFGTYDQAEEVVMTNAGFIKVKKDGMKIQ